MTYRTRRLLAKHTRMMRVLGHSVRSCSESDGWSRTYDVRIAGRRFTLWERPLTPQTWWVSVYAVTIDGRVRFIDRSSIFATALSGWEALTGIRYLGRYENGSPVHGHRLPVELVPIQSASGFPFNYSLPIVQTDNLPAKSVGTGHDPFAVGEAA